MQVAIGHELIHQHLQPIFVTEACNRQQMAVVEAAEQVKFVPELALPLRTFIGSTLNGNHLPIWEHTTVDFSESPFSDAALVAEVGGGNFQLLECEPG